MNWDPATTLAARVVPLLAARESGSRADARHSGTARRVIVGITGAPGSGKSTLAERLVAHVGADRAVAVPMDGFHLSNEELTRLGLSAVKGAPQTFDAWGFVHLMRRLRAAEELVYAPLFYRHIEQSIGSALPVPSERELVVVEGNYLLLPTPPWTLARPLFDLVAYLEVPDEVRLPRLLARARRGGRDEAEARDWVLRNDESNARIVAATRDLADVVLHG